MLPGIDLEGKRVLVVGLERTGLATARFCLARGARVTASELRPERRWPARRASCARRASRSNSEAIAGKRFSPRT